MMTHVSSHLTKGDPNTHLRFNRYAARKLCTSRCSRASARTSLRPTHPNACMTTLRCRSSDATNAASSFSSTSRAAGLLRHRIIMSATPEIARITSKPSPATNSGFPSGIPTSLGVKVASAKLATIEGKIKTQATQNRCETFGSSQWGLNGHTVDAYPSRNRKKRRVMVCAARGPRSPAKAGAPSRPQESKGCPEFSHRYFYYTHKKRPAERRIRHRRRGGCRRV